MPTIDINISPLEKELRGIIYQIVNDEMKKFNAKETLIKLAKQFLDKNAEKMIKSRVYKYLEEAQIDLSPHAYQSQKITLNTFIIKVVKECVENRVFELFQNKIKIDISINDKKKEPK